MLGGETFANRASSQVSSPLPLSSVATVQLSLHSAQFALPSVSIGSIVNIMPGVSSSESSFRKCFGSGARDRDSEIWGMEEDRAKDLISSHLHVRGAVEVRVDTVSSIFLHRIVT